MESCNISNGFSGGIACLRNNAPAGGFMGVIDSVIDILLFTAVIASALFLIFGGIRYITSAGNQSRVTDAKNTILYAILGLVIAFVALGLVTFIGRSLQG